MSLNWPDPMPDTGYFPNSAQAWINGICLVIDPKRPNK
jgi:hypothetical protein